MQILLAEVDAVYARRNCGEKFVGDGVEGGGEALHGHLCAVDFDGVADGCCGYVGDVDHALVHTDVANCGTFDAADHERGGASTEVAVDTIGIADGDGGDDRRASEFSSASIADGGAGGPVFD